MLDTDAARPRVPASTDPALTNTQKNNEKKKPKKKQKKQQYINQQALLPDQSIMHPIIAAAHFCCGAGLRCSAVSHFPPPVSSPSVPRSWPSPVPLFSPPRPLNDVNVLREALPAPTRG